MEFYKDLYWGGSLEKKKEKILRGLKRGKTKLHLYLIVLPQGDKNQLEFFDALLLKQKWFRSTAGRLKVVGITNGYEEALEAVQCIMEETVRKTGEANIRTYLEQNWK